MLSSIKEYRDYILSSKDIIPHIRKLHEIIEMCGIVPEGNLFTHDKTLIYDSKLLTKQVNMWRIGKTATNIIEVGFNAGHSCLLFLMANPTSRITIFDIGWHPYTKPCFDYLDSAFPGRMTYYKGDSLCTLGCYTTDLPFDVAHIDGAHDHVHFLSDITNISRMVTSDNVTILDDATCHPLDKIVDILESASRLERLTGFEDTELYPHVITRLYIPK